METTTTSSATSRPVRLISFGFGHDDPPTADVTLDVRRWLHNPDVAAEIVPLDGRDAVVQQVVYGTPGAVAAVDHLGNLVENYPAGRECVLAIGCTGGRHRSVALTELAAGRLSLRGHHVQIEHRDVHRPVLRRPASTGAAPLPAPPAPPAARAVSRTLPAEPRRQVREHLYYEAPRYYRPQVVDGAAVFLGGGITGCPPWHRQAIRTLGDAPEPLVVLNPNRADFPIDDPSAGWEQVSWEQHHLHLEGLTTLMWFPASDPQITVQPIALFELGQALGEGRKLVVGADPAYPRAADVHMLCQLARSGMPVYTSLEDVLAATIVAARVGSATASAA
jgi:hypothetical protein